MINQIHFGDCRDSLRAIEHGRQFVGCELNPDYKPLQDARIASALTGGLL